MDSTYILIVVGTFVPVVALFKRELLVETRSSGFILAISLVSLIFGIGVLFCCGGRFPAVGALIAPLPSFGLYRLLRHLFVACTKREPRDTWNDWSPGMAADRLFNIVYFTAAFILPMLFTVGVKELARRGW